MMMVYYQEKNEEHTSKLAFKSLPLHFFNLTMKYTLIYVKDFDKTIYQSHLIREDYAANRTPRDLQKKR